MKSEVFIDGPGGYRIPCLTTMKRDLKKLVIIVHGFGSSMRSAIAEKLSFALPILGMGTVSFDFPAHGIHDRDGDFLRVDSCLDDLAAVEKVFNEMYPNSEIYYFASSFGAYITLLYLSKRRFLGKKAFLRCAAVDMKSIFDDMTPPEYMDMMNRDGYIINGLYDRPVKVTRDFYGDLCDNNLFECFDRGGLDNILMVHGTDDETALFKDAEAFASKYGIRFIAKEGADHRFTSEENERFLLAEALSFFSFDSEASVVS